MDNRSIDLFDLPQVDTKHETSHVHASLRACSDGTYTVFVTRYRDVGDGVRGYTLAASRGQAVERFARFSAKRLADLAADPGVVGLARALAGL